MGSYLNPGNLSFRGSLRSKIYVDKSELIARTNEALCTEQKYICVSRPRRFGKSMAANMLAAYYDRSEDTTELFQNLAISKDRSYRENLNQYDVIKINMQEFLSMSETMEEMLEMLKNYLILDFKETFHEIQFRDEKNLIQVMKDVFRYTKCPFVILIDEWEKDVPAIIFSFYSGMEGGNVLADILFGDVCPSGKLPYTVALSEDSYPDFDPHCTYAEYEYYHGYCKMDKENIPVLYPFGYGLSYTTFDISEPTVEVFDKTAKISVNVKNTGDVKGAEVVQLYIGCEGSAVDRPVKILKDFARVELMPGEEKKVSLQVSSKDMAYYSEEKDDFVEEDITYIAYTGDCSCKEALKSVKFEFGK